MRKLLRAIDRLGHAANFILHAGLPLILVSLGGLTAAVYRAFRDGAIGYHLRYAPSVPYIGAGLFLIVLVAVALEYAEKHPK